MEGLEKEILKVRESGFHVILMMDANEDWTKADGKELREFVTRLQLK